MNTRVKTREGTASTAESAHRTPSFEDAGVSPSTTQPDFRPR